jgi:energy-coupling factor transport system ATP-binding protein
VSRGRLLFEGREWSEYDPIERATAVQFVGQLPVQQLSGREFTVRDEIAFGPGNLGLSPGEVSNRTDESLHLCGLEELAGRDPFTLSGGEQQRLIFATAVAMRSRLLILDEPLTNLDPSAADRILTVLKLLSSSITVIWLDTSPAATLSFARRFALFEQGQCRLDGTAADVLLDPASIASIGLPPVAVAARLAAATNLWNAAVPYPLTVEEAERAFAEVEHGAG